MPAKKTSKESLQKAEKKPKREKQIKPDSKSDGYELIITEKPKVALKIANALADDKVNKDSEKGAPYYEITHKNRKIFVGCAVGHLFGLMEKGGNKWKYPVFDVEWVPLSKMSKSSSFSKKYLDVLKKISANANAFTVATDYDVEGEVIGLNVLRFACKQQDGSRMKFSALTKPDLVNAYENKMPTIDWGQAEAGLLRHEMDYYYGINISRALTSAMKTAGTFMVLSSGRVQGPTLKIIVDREEEIKSFVAKKYWQIRLLGKAESDEIEAWHKKNKFWEKKEADDIMEKTSERKCFVKNVQREEVKKFAPNPFDLTTLQMETYRCFRINPKRCLEIAQSLYTDGLISYPRTSSQQLPFGIGFVSIMKSLYANDAYVEKIKELTLMLSGHSRILSKEELFRTVETVKLVPNNGSKTDPAHPAIYPTGITPKKLSEEERKIYDLIVKRFIATFGKAAVKEKVVVELSVEDEMFVANGMTTLERAWYSLYEPYAISKEVEVPRVEIGDEIKVKSIEELEKETQPPKRYSPASLVKELANKNLGTKATRAQIIDTLFRRGYVKGQLIEATELGIQTEKILEKYCPEIVDEELTRHFEIESDMVMEKKKKREEVLEEAKKVLLKVLEKFTKKEREVGKDLKSAYKETRHTASFIGECPVCKKGSLKIITSKKTRKRFIACDRYPECKTTFGIPQSGGIKPIAEKCEKCGSPMVVILYKGKKPWKFCINPNCPSKEEYKKKKMENSANNNSNSDKDNAK